MSNEITGKLRLGYISVKLVRSVFVRLCVIESSIEEKVSYASSACSCCTLPARIPARLYRCVESDDTQS